MVHGRWPTQALPAAPEGLPRERGGEGPGSPSGEGPHLTGPRAARGGGHRAEPAVQHRLAGSRRSPSAAARAGQRPSPRGSEEGKEQAGSPGKPVQRGRRNSGRPRLASPTPLCPGRGGLEETPLRYLLGGLVLLSPGDDHRPSTPAACAQPVTSASPAAAPGRKGVPSRRLPGSPAPAQWFARTLLAYKRIRAVPFTAKGVRGKEGGGCAAPRRLMWLTACSATAGAPSRPRPPVPAGGAPGGPSGCPSGCPRAHGRAWTAGWAGRRPLTACLLPACTHWSRVLPLCFTGVRPSPFSSFFSFARGPEASHQHGGQVIECSVTWEMPHGLSRPTGHWQSSAAAGFRLVT